MTMNKQEFLVRSGLTGQTLDFWLEQQWLIPEQTSIGVSFSDVDIARTQLIHELKAGFGINDEGIDVILHLIDQLHGLRGALGRLHEEFSAGIRR